jgi:hypothetical protein
LEALTVDIGKDEHDFVTARRAGGERAGILGRIREANMFATGDRTGVAEALM